MIKRGAPRRGRPYWERVVAAAEAEGASQREVAARFGVRLSTLRTWIYRLRREAREAQSTTPPVRVLPVAVTGLPPARGLEVRVGEFAVAVPEGADPRYVAALVRALRDAC